MSKDEDGALPRPSETLEQVYESFVEAHCNGEFHDLDAYCSRYQKFEPALRRMIEDFLFAMRGTRALQSVQPKTIGPYKIESVLGEGGMGVVYLATQDQPISRQVAIKLIKPGMDSRAILRRFQSERRALALMDHPGIARIYDTGTTGDGRPYFVMEYVRGTPLNEYCDANQLSVPARLRLFRQVCDGVQHAHQKAIIHRDLKPTNVLVTTLDRGPSTKIIDFGLAKALEYRPDQSFLTVKGMLVGTPEYMSPEQADSSDMDVDTRADVYALGVILYRLLTGSLPFEFTEFRQAAHLGALERMRKMICEEEPLRPSSRVESGKGLESPIPVDRPSSPRPRVLARRLRGELDWIVMKALEKERSRRYATANDLSADIGRHLDGEPVAAGPPSATYRLKKLVRKHAGLVAALSVVFLAIAVGGAVAVSFYFRAETKRVEAEEQRARVLRLADATRLEQLLLEADSLWPAHPDKILDMDNWIQRAREFTRRLDEHEFALLDLTLDGTGDTDRDGQQLVSTEKQWWAGQLGALVNRLKRLDDPDPRIGTIANVEQRIHHASTVVEESIRKPRESWNEAIQSIGDEEQCPTYRGLKIEPQLGLVPLGRDPSSGLWEFLHLHTHKGTIPERGEDGELRVSEGTGIVFVLVPGGRFWMGAQGRSIVKPNYDPFSQTIEQPVHSVTLDPFFLAKYELTQGQWETMTGKKPSFFSGSASLEDGSRSSASYLHPVEQISWEECWEALRRFDLLLPTEAQWEYAARGKTSTPWWMGLDPQSAERSGNFADKDTAYRVDLYSMGMDPAIRAPSGEQDDRHVFHAPVGSFRPNPFGLHEILGNVGEWCRDTFANYEVLPAGGHGNRVPDLSDDGSQRHLRIWRGGSFYGTAESARSSVRRAMPFGAAARDVGVRASHDLVGYTRSDSEPYEELLEIAVGIDYQTVMLHIEYSQYGARYQEYVRGKYRPVWLDAQVHNGKQYLTGIYALLTTDHYLTYQFISLGTLWIIHKKSLRLGHRVIHLDLVTDDITGMLEEGIPRFNLLTLREEGPPQELVAGKTLEEFAKEDSRLRSSGFLPIMISTDVIRGELLVAAVYDQDDSGTEVAVFQEIDPKDFSRLHDEQRARGLGPSSIDARTVGDSAKICAVFRSDRTGSTALCNLSAEELHEKREEMARIGLKLISIAGYHLEGQPRYVTIWSK